MSSCHQGLSVATTTTLIACPVHSRAKHSSKAAKHRDTTSKQREGREAHAPGAEPNSPEPAGQQRTLCGWTAGITVAGGLMPSHPSFSSSLEKPHPRNVCRFCSSAFAPTAYGPLGLNHAANSQQQWQPRAFHTCSWGNPGKRGKYCSGSSCHIFPPWCDNKTLLTKKKR